MDAGRLPAGGGAHAPDLQIRAITADSRQVVPGTLFAALPGSRVDGRAYIPEAIRRGAVAILTGTDAVDGVPADVPVIADANPRRRLALLAARFHGAQPRVVAAVTGTNGKTSTAVFTRQIWSALGARAASLGTLGVEGPDVTIPGAMTTPDPVALHALLADLVRRGVDHLAMEASSHGLNQFRLDGVRLRAAAFTNLSQDHLDYHGSMTAYLAAKLRLFREVLPAGGTAVLNADIPEFAEAAAAARAAGQTVLDFGRTAEALRLVERRPAAAGQALVLDVLGTRHAFELPLIGQFQAMNALAALGLAIGTGADPHAATAVLAGLAGVPGRLQAVAQLPNGASVFVDYAHTPDGLEQVLSAIRPHTTGRLWAVFGAGGDRDRTKRPLMGAVVARLADRAIVTDDNPRSEVPATIRAAIRGACPAADEIGDRAAAIEAAMTALGPGDALVIAGKGHETGQTVAGVTHPFDDAEVARDVAARIGGAP